MESDQALFAAGLLTYEKVVRLNYMAHREVYGLLRQVLLTEAPERFVFLDLACSTATASVEALKGTDIGKYIGIDISKPSLQAAEIAVSGLRCKTELRCQDFVEAIEAWNEPVQVIWIGQSLHHLRAPEKRSFMQRVHRLLPDNGLFLIWEPTCVTGEDREGWFERYELLRPQWSMVTDDEFAAFASHCRASDYAETCEEWKAIGREAGFERVDELLRVPNRLARVYRYSH